GSVNSTETGKAMMMGVYKYTIRVKIKGLNDTLTLDPQVEISGGDIAK
ncbi:MAG: hypothetical protein JO360_05215, partial [Acidobacteria bacterium]|nr:hypothetical protein [Acidobacteriota bacterium]